MAFKDMALLFVLVLCTLLVEQNVRANDTPCFVFKGNSFLAFPLPQRFSNNDNVHYEFQIRTSNLNGLLMYAVGPGHDFEALYIRGGNLHYHLFNTGSDGLGSQFGGYFVSRERVDNNSWITVHLYRSWVEQGHGSIRQSQNKTGIEFMLNGRLRSYVDNRNRTGINISNTIYFGGYPTELSTTVRNYYGEMRGFIEHKSNHLFENPSMNSGQLVEFNCRD